VGLPFLGYPWHIVGACALAGNEPGPERVEQGVQSVTSTRPLPLIALSMLLVAQWGCDENLVGEMPDSGAADTGVSDGGDGDAGVEDNPYPDGPYGGFLDDTIANYSFNGYINDHPSEGAVEASGYVEGFTLQDIRRLGTYDFLLINVAAEWCAGCRVEAQQIPGLYDGWADKRGYVMSVITQDSRSEPALKRHLDSWISTYPINYTMVHDPQGFIDREIGPDVLPLNIIIDLRTMKILHRVFGEDFTIFETFEALLPGE